VILAAGVGSRYGGLKQLDPVGPAGEALLDYSIYDAVRAGFQSVVLVVREETETSFRESLGRRIGGRVPLAYVHQRLDDLPAGIGLPSTRAKPWGTGQAVLAARKEVTGPFAVINADDFYGAEAFASLAAFMNEPDVADHSPPTFAMVGYRLTDTLSEAGSVSRGVCRHTADGWLEEIEEILAIHQRGQDGYYEDAAGHEQILSGKTPISTNNWGFTPEIFSLLESAFQSFLQEQIDNPKAEFLLPQVLNEAIRAGHARIKVLAGGTRWLGVTYREDKPEVTRRIEAMIAAGEYPRELWAGA
jgi:dTDP-glucose pyrophosphorylase